RWSQTIRGGEGVLYSSMVLDNNGGIYISFRGSGNSNAPLCFSEEEDVCLPPSPPWGQGAELVQEGHKRIFLLKYNAANVDLLWRKNYQGDVNIDNKSWIV